MRRFIPQAALSSTDLTTNIRPRRCNVWRMCNCKWTSRKKSWRRCRKKRERLACTPRCTIRNNVLQELTDDPNCYGSIAGRCSIPDCSQRPCGHVSRVTDDLAVAERIREVQEMASHIHNDLAEAARVWGCR